MPFWQSPEYAAFWLTVARGDLATWLQLTPYAYATLEGVHLIGTAFFLGAIFLLDLRLLGLAPRLGARPTERFLLGITVPAFLLLAGSGALLFVPSADRYATSPVFFLKVGAIALGGLNALAFHRRASRPVESGAPAQIARMARTAAVLSVVVWVTVIALGRAMGYERRDPAPSDLESLPWLGATLDTRGALALRPGASCAAQSRYFPSHSASTSDTRLGACSR